MSGCGCEVEVKPGEQSRVLWWLLAINGVMFVVELGVGLWADSSGLVADSLDMLADAAVYGVALYAVAQSARHKASAAMLSGVLQILLAMGVLLDVLRRFWVGSEPVSEVMMLMASVALMANLVCLRLIHKHRHGEVHMRASWIFSANDVIANAGVILAGVLVWWLNSALPDLFIGLAIAVLVLRGGLVIVREARQSAQGSGCCSG
ncbi:MAG: cation transporter [Gammaproteobacteria bacterium]|nr:cation transporter [Gammaproteobacteria bacterium]